MVSKREEGAGVGAWVEADRDSRVGADRKIVGTQSQSVYSLLYCKLPKYLFRASGPLLSCVDIWGGL